MGNQAQRSFASGELAPEMQARTDLARYASGLSTCRNYYVRRSGGLDNRPGTGFVARTKFGAASVARLVKFVFNRAQTNVLEFGDEYIRIHQDGAYLGVEVVTTYAAEDLATLRFDQSADVITITHPSYPIRELHRVSALVWTISDVDTEPTIDPPTNLILSFSTGTPVGVQYVVTAVARETGQESYASDISGDVMDRPSPTTPVHITWDPSSGAAFYRVYRAFGISPLDAFALVGTAQQTAFTDSGDFVDVTFAPPTARNPFDSAGEYPTAVRYHQQRRFFAGPTSAPETTWASRIGDYANFRVHVPVLDDDPVTFTMAGERVHQIEHLAALKKLFAFTQGSIIRIDGDEAGIIRPAAVGPVRVSGHGCSFLPPIPVGESLLYVQADESIVRDLQNDLEDNERSDDLTAYSSHLLDGYTIVDWDFQAMPHPIVWAVRSDGVLLGLTYNRQQELVGWHRHDTDGVIENVCVVPEGKLDRVYIIVKRTINSVIERYIERLEVRTITDLTDVRDLRFMDSCLSYDGRDAGAEDGITMMLTGGTTWEDGETMQLVASDNYFSMGSVGNGVVLHASDGSTVLATITAYTSPTEVDVLTDKNVPVILQDVAVDEWDAAVDQVGGLGHLEGKSVSVFADGYVVASPNNASVGAPVVVSSGVATLDALYSVIHVGLPYTSDLVTLDIDSAQGPSLKSTKMLVNKVTVLVSRARGLWAGGAVPTGSDQLEGLEEMQYREAEPYADPVALTTGEFDIDIQNDWNSSGRVLIRQVDPLPVTVLAVIPQGTFQKAA